MHDGEEVDPITEFCIRHVRTTPPRFLSEFRAEPFGIDQPWNNSADWRVSCRCGSRLMTVLAHLNEIKPGGPYSKYLCPFSLHCPNCDKTAPFFDRSEHGYDGECGRLFPGYNAYMSKPDLGELAAVRCKKCGKSEFAVEVHCTHSHFDVYEDLPEARERLEDFFDWIVGWGLCGACGERMIFMDIELA